ncbi:hypothetical protein NOC27_3424 [Nitrosococcus oceani AFC27]|nr:hypothetical protein NOC27_3424 [Nitrosococcus oceani AFC27]
MEGSVLYKNEILSAESAEQNDRLVKPLSDLLRKTPSPQKVNPITLL